jgi:DNA-binding YbaB/EbfC family protein
MVDRPPEDPEGPALPTGLPDLGSLLETASQLQEQLAAARQQAAEQVVEGTAGGGAVRIEVSGELEPLAVRIDPSVVDPADVALLEDLVLAALRDATTKVAAAQEQVQQAALGDLGGLGDLLR